MVPLYNPTAHIGGCIQNLEPTAGFGPATRCLQISWQLNLARDFRFPCIPRMSIKSKDFQSGGYNGGYRNQTGKLAATHAHSAKEARGVDEKRRRAIARTPL
jgi:hypothetical protein